MRTTTGILAVMILASGLAAWAENILVNADFAEGLKHWEPYGNDKGLIRLEYDVEADGADGVAVPCAHASIAQNMALKPRAYYELSISYRRSSPSTRGGLVFFFNRQGGINASAGVINIEFPRKTGAVVPEGWEEFREVFRTPPTTRAGKVVLSARMSGEVLYRRVSLREVPAPSGAREMIKPSDWSIFRTTRTRNPVFEELLTDEPGGYRVVAWSHNLNRKNLPASLLDKYPADKWDDTVTEMFREAGAVGLGYYSLPGYGDRADDLYRRFGVTFDVACEWSNVTADAIKAGAEVLNPIAVSTTSAKSVCSLIDPIYTSTAAEVLKRNAERFKGQPFVFVYVGDDEPSIRMPDGPISGWGPFGKQCAEEVKRDYGFGRYAIPAPQDPGYLSDDKNRPFRWIAFNRWMADKWASARKTLYDTLKSVDPDVRYNPCDYWFMTGFTPFDFAAMAKCSDLVECDPYASSAERIPGRGLYNHSFGPKLLSDLTGKPVRSIVQAFDYAGYEMTPKDLREWVSQSLRGGASHISYYQMDNPRFNDHDRWAMMLHLSKVVTTMNAIERPIDAEVAILYSSDSHRAEGASTKANEVYTAHSILGERVGSWFDFVDDESLIRGQKSLSKYRAVYIPLGTYQRESVVRRIEAFVRGGGTVICGDPSVFSWDIDGRDLSKSRERIFGVRTIRAVDRVSMVLRNDGGIPGMKVGETLPVYRPVGRDGWTEDNGWLVEISRPGVEVLATFADGSPAITMTRYGKGRAIYFAANPFVPECLIGDGRWDAFFRALQEHLGAKTDRPIWRFKLPAP